MGKLIGMLSAHLFEADLDAKYAGPSLESRLRCLLSIKHLRSNRQSLFRQSHR
jgi:hypothetical protein